jgi:glutathione S-transferase
MYEKVFRRSVTGGTMRKLYDFELSGSCYKVRLLLNILNIPYEKQNVDFVHKEHKNPTFLALNPMGEIPIYEEEGLRLRDAQAILVYIAGKYDPARRWWPADASAQGRITQWLSIGGNEIMSAAGARLVKLLQYDLDLKKLQDRAINTFRILDAHLSDRHWLELGHPTIADIACFPYTALAGEGDISLQPYHNIRAWIERIKQLSRFIAMPGI